MTRRKLKHHFVDGRPAAHLIVSDPMAGRRNVYTVYRIGLAADKQAHVIGRELDLRTAKTIVFNDQEALRKCHADLASLIGNMAKRKHKS